MEVPALDLQAQYRGIRDEVAQAVGRVLESQHFILGPAVSAFEEDMAAFIGVSHALGVSSGSDALLLALMALDVEPGDEVITTPYTFFATAGVIARLHATPVFVDIDPGTCNIDASGIEAAITEKTKAVLPVHLYGQCAEMGAVLEIAGRHGLPVVEDAAQAIGARCAAGAAGSMGAVGCFSFYPTKNLGGAGEGGLVATADPALEEKMRRLRDHGMHPRNVHALIGGNFRMDALQGAVLGVKLKHLLRWNEARRDIARFYDEAFAGRPEIVTPVVAPDNYGVHHQYVVRVPNRDAVHDALRAAGIGAAVYYPIPLHLQGCFAYLGYREGDFPEAERAARETLALPIYPELTADQTAHVAQSLLAAVSS